MIFENFMTKFHELPEQPSYCVSFRHFPLGVGSWLWFVIVALAGLFY